ncbi:MAG: tol-pal system protein YbgF [Nitrospinae bacterium]|nr:tol-pal system protein YbgF [Nitrospinota bacterium]
MGLLLGVTFLALTAASGCASNDTGKLKDDVDALKNQVWSLQKQTSELNLRLAYVNDDLSYLTERVGEFEEREYRAHASSQGKKEKGGALKEIQTAASEPPADGANQPERGFDTPPESRFKDLSPEEMYKESLVYFNKKDYSSAVAGFNYLIRRHPGASVAPNAQYWIGEAFFEQKRYLRAAEEFRKVTARYPGAPKTADAMLKTAQCKLALDQTAEGEEILKELINKHPDSAAAATAKKIMERPGEPKN